MEDPIIVPIKMEEPTTTPKEINQPAADDKVEEITPIGEPAEKNNVDKVAPTDNNKGEPTKTVAAPCADHEDTPVVIKLEEPAVVFANEESSIDKLLMR
ncbi:autotransporter outer membrane beta-barrel domain-containing [Sesbania bispinosa]|nr:autotransporter outer membrane beta-barrel domain-containing [Sesbania bispinosa]